MYKLQLSLVPTNTSRWQRPSAPEAPIILLEEVLPCERCTTLRCSGSPFCSGHGPEHVVYRSPMAVDNSRPYQREPSSGPQRRNRNKQGLHEAEASKPNQFTHESSETVSYDGSIGIDLGHAWINANNETGKGKVWRTPSKNSLTIDRNLT